MMRSLRAHIASEDNQIEKVATWTPDKDLAQCVRGTRLVQIDGRRKIIRNAAGIREKFGVDPPLTHHYIDTDAGDGAARLQKLGGEKVILSATCGGVAFFPVALRLSRSLGEAISDSTRPTHPLVCCTLG